MDMATNKTYKVVVLILNRSTTHTCFSHLPIVGRCKLLWVAHRAALWSNIMNVLRHGDGITMDMTMITDIKTMEMALVDCWFGS